MNDAPTSGERGPEFNPDNIPEDIFAQLNGDDNPETSPSADNQPHERISHSTELPDDFLSKLGENGSQAWTSMVPDTTHNRFGEIYANNPDELDPEAIRDRLEGVKDAFDLRNAADEPDQEQYEAIEFEREETSTITPGSLVHFKEGELREGGDPEYSYSGYAAADTFVAARAPEAPGEEVILNANSDTCRIVAIQKDEFGALVHINASEALSDTSDELIAKALESVPELSSGTATIFGDIGLTEQSQGADQEWNERVANALEQNGIEIDDIVTEGTGKDVYLQLKSDGNHVLHAKDNDGNIIFDTENN